MTNSSSFSSGLQLVGRWCFPIGMFLVGLFFAVFAFQVRRIGAEQPGDPGPEFLPCGLGCLLIAISFWSAWTSRSEASGKAPAVSVEGERLMLWLIAGMIVYLPALSWLGFSASSVIAGVFLLRALGSRWSVALAAALAVVLFAKVLFTWGFSVQLPEGALESWLAM